jgi:DNA-binding response OmpR family regulator
MARIYIVEDGRDLAWVLSESFTLAGHTVMVAVNGLEALQQMRQQTPDLVILDVNMPVMDGFALARRMRGDPLLAWVPIIFLTVHSDFPSKAEGFRVGGDDYVVKPFDLPELHARVQAILRRCRIEDSSRQDVVQVGKASLNLSTGSFQINSHSAQLTDIERDILRYLMLHAGKPVSAQELLEDVLDYPAGTGDPSAVRWHIKNLRQKIEADPSRPTHLITAPPRGYSFS